MPLRDVYRAIRYTPQDEPPLTNFIRARGVKVSDCPVENDGFPNTFPETSKVQVLNTKC